jgi:dephospho-CoA kinase
MARLRLALGGRMQVGKTTAADYVVERYGFRKYALADPIKQLATESFGWDGGKDDRGRRLLQEIGTVGRNYDPELWLDRFAQRITADDGDRLVVDDLRLTLEVEYLERLGFACVQVVRAPELITTLPPEVARQQHETEVELERLGFGYRLENNGTFEELFGQIDALMADLSQKRG